MYLSVSLQTVQPACCQRAHVGCCPQAMSPRVRKLLKWMVTVVLLAVVLPRVDFRALHNAFASLSVWQAGGLLLLVCLQQGLLTKRFATVLHALIVLEKLGRVPRLSELLLDQQVGCAYNVVLPSAVGGDVIRALRARRRISDAPAASAIAWGAVLLDRLIGLLALVLVPLVGLLLGFGPRSSVLLRAAAAIALLLAPLVAFAGRLFVWLARLTRTRFVAIHQLAADIGRVLESATWSTRLGALGWSLVYQLAVSAYFHIAAAAFDLPLELAFSAIWIGLPLAFVLSTLPVTIGSLGLRESLFIGILGLYGIAPAPALALALLWGAQGLLTALAGLIALWFERLPTRAATAE